MPSAVTWMDLEIIIRSEVSQRETNIIWYHICGIQKKKMQINLFTKQNRLRENKLMVTKEERRGGTNTIYETDKQQGPTVEHRKLYSRSLIAYNEKEDEKYIDN